MAITNIVPRLLDTCALIWLVNGDEMSESSIRRIDEAAEAGCLYVHPMSAWEVGMLVAKGRLSLTMPVARWFERIEANAALTIISVDVFPLIESTQLPGEPPNDPVDRMMIAAARNMGGQLITRDKKILSYGALGYVSVLPC